MTVKELKQKLEGVPDTMDVFIHQTNDEFAFSYVEEARVVDASFSEDSGPVLAKAKVFVITDDIQ